MIEFTPRTAEDAATPAAGKYSLFMTLDGALALKDSDGNVTPYARAEDVPGEYGLPDIIERRQFLSGFLEGNLIGPNNTFVDPTKTLLALGLEFESNVNGQYLRVPIGMDTVIIQWGTGTTGANGLSVGSFTFPATFTDTAKCGIWATPSGATGTTNVDGNRTYGSIVTTSTYRLGCDDNATAVYWLAIGV